MEGKIFSWELLGQPLLPVEWKRAVMRCGFVSVFVLLNENEPIVPVCRGEF